MGTKVAEGGVHMIYYQRDKKIRNDQKYKNYKNNTKTIICHLFLRWWHTQANYPMASGGDFICEKCGIYDHDYETYPKILM